MKSIKLLLFISLGIVLFSSCSKKQGTPTLYITSELKDYALFQKGSYWVYKNDIRQSYDSSRILNDPSVSYFLEGGYDYEYLGQVCHIHYTGTFINDAYLGPYDYDLSIRGIAFEPIKFVSGTTFTFSDRRKTLTFSKIDTLPIFEKVFYNVLKTTYVYIAGPNDTISNTSFFVKKVGLVKYISSEAGIDSTWNLYDYKVIQ